MAAGQDRFRINASISSASTTHYGQRAASRYQGQAGELASRRVDGEAA